MRKNYHQKLYGMAAIVFLAAGALSGGAAAYAQTIYPSSGAGNGSSSTPAAASSTSPSSANESSAQPSAASYTPPVMALMPVLYDQNGAQVNAGAGSLAAGWYYLQSDAAPSSRVYYYGNGIYYDPSTGIYGGSAVRDPSGRAGVYLGYAESVVTPSYPGAPNTGAGGQAAANWLVLIAAGLVMMSGAVYAVGRLAYE